MDRQPVALEGGHHLLGELARQALALHPLLGREAHGGILLHLLARGVDRAAPAEAAVAHVRGRNVGHQPPQGGVERVGVDRQEDHLVGVLVGLQGLAVEAVGEIPAEVHPDLGIGDRIGGRGQHGVAAREGEDVGVLDLEVGAVAGGHQHAGRRLRLELLLDPHRDVVDVEALPDAAEAGPGVQPAVAGVEDDGDPVEPLGLDLVAEAGALAQPLLVFLALGMPLGEVLRLQILERDLDPVADRDVGHVRDAAAPGDRARELVDVLGEDAAGEAHHHRGVEGLVGAQPVDGVLAVLVRAVLEEVGLLGHRERRAEGRPQQLRGDGHREVAGHVLVVELVVLADGAEILAVAGEPDRQAPQALPP